MGTNTMCDGLGTEFLFVADLRQWRLSSMQVWLDIFSVISQAYMVLEHASTRFLIMMNNHFTMWLDPKSRKL